MRWPVSLATVASNGDGRGVPSGHNPIMPRRVMIFEQPRSAVADVEIARDGEQERSEPRVGAQLRRAIDEAQPRLFEQILRHFAAARQPREEVEQPRVEFGMDDVERGGIAGAQPRHEIELRLPVHGGHNARDSES